MIATDHTHTSLGVGDVKKAADNDFTGDNSFSGETTFTNLNPVSLMTNSGSTSLKFKQSTLESDPAGDITYFTGNNINGDLIMSANKVILRNQASTDPVTLASDKITTTVLPECSATPSTSNQLVNKTYADTKVSKSGDETIAGVKNFTSNVGIGTSSPQRLLHLNNGSGDVYLQMTCRDSGATTSDGFHIRQEPEGHIHFSQNENAEMLFLTNNTERIRLSSGGLVGIGASIPTAQLHIHENSTSKNTQLKLSHSTTGTVNDADGFDLVLERTSNDAYIIQRENADMFFRTNNTDRMLITNNGRVGIGTTSPNSVAKLHVAAGSGTFDFNDTIKFFNGDI